MKRQAIVAQGTVEGLAAEDQGITVFRGVPFAQPPVGGLRWRAPQPALPWDGVLQAFDFGPTAMQPTPGASDDFYDREWGHRSGRADERGLPLPEYLDSGITRIWRG